MRMHQCTIMPGNEPYLNECRMRSFWSPDLFARGDSNQRQNNEIDNFPALNYVSWLSLKQLEKASMSLLRHSEHRVLYCTSTRSRLGHDLGHLMAAAADAER